MLFDKKYKEYMSQFGLLTERCVPPMEILQKYKEDDNAFISFTNFVEPRGQKQGEKATAPKSTTKIGINPWSSYDTPIGVYFYPIKPYWSKLEKRNIDFAGDQPHVYIAKAKNPEKLLYGSRYTNEDYKRDLEILGEIFHMNEGEFDAIERGINSSYKRYPAQKFWSMTREFAKIIAPANNNKIPVIWTHIMSRFYDGVIDDAGWGFIHPNEPTQAVIWTKAQFDVVDYVDRTCKGKYTKREDYLWDNNNTINNLLKGYFINKKIPDKYKNLEADVIEKYQDIILSVPASYEYATDVLHGQNVPDEILKNIRSDKYHRYYYLEYLNDENLPFPEIFFQDVLDNSKYSYLYAIQLGREGKYIPDELLHAISRSPEYSYAYVKYYTENPEKMRIIDEIMESILSDTSYTYIYAIETLGGNNVPEEFIKKISTNAGYSQEYVGYLLKQDKQPPHELILGIARSAIHSYKTAVNYHNAYKTSQIPREIIEGISQSSELSYKFADEILKWKNVPAEIIAIIKKNIISYYKYVTEVLISNGENAPDDFLKAVVSDRYYTYQYYSFILSHAKNRYREIFRLFKFMDLSDIDQSMLDKLSKNMTYTYKFIDEVLIPKGIDINEIFEADAYSKWSPLKHAILQDSGYTKLIARKYYNWKNLPKKFKETLKYENIPSNSTLQESHIFSFDGYYENLMESLISNTIDMDRAYEIFNQEYLQSTGKSWSKDKFLNRVRNWEFWGDENGFVTTRRQNSGFVKLVGAAGSDKSKYKGFKELASKNLPVWGMVDAKIQGLLKKMGYRGPNMVERLAFQGLLKSGKMDAVLGGAKLESIKGDQITLTYPDIGTVTKYFMGSPEYWKMMHRSFLSK